MIVDVFTQEDRDRLARYRSEQAGNYIVWVMAGGAFASYSTLYLLNLFIPSVFAGPSRSPLTFIHNLGDNRFIYAWLGVSLVFIVASLISSRLLGIIQGMIIGFLFAGAAWLFAWALFVVAMGQSPEQTSLIRMTVVIGAYVLSVAMGYFGVYMPRYK